MVVLFWPPLPLGVRTDILFSVSSSFGCEDGCCVGSIFTVNLFWYQLESLIILAEIILKEPGNPEWSSKYMCTVNGSFYLLCTSVNFYLFSVKYYGSIQIVSVINLCILIFIMCTKLLYWCYSFNEILYFHVKKKKKRFSLLLIFFFTASIIFTVPSFQQLDTAIRKFWESHGSLVS